MRYLQGLVAVAVVMALGGCAAMDQIAGMGVITQRASTFDNATVIEVSPNSLYDPSSPLGTPLQVGARWSSAAPNYVALILAYHSRTSGSAPVYLGLTAVDINIDGAVSSYAASEPTRLGHSAYNTVSHTIYTSSDNSIVIPYALLQRMVAAKSCRIRLHTSDGYQDADFSADHIPGGKPTALASIRKFMVKVDAARGDRRSPLAPNVTSRGTWPLPLPQFDIQAMCQASGGNLDACINAEQSAHAWLASHTTSVHIAGDCTAFAQQSYAMIQACVQQREGTAR